MRKKTINSILLLIFSTRLIILFFCLCSQSHLILPLEKHDDVQQVVVSALLPKSANHGKPIDYFTNFIRRVLHVKPPVIYGDENDGRVVELTAKNFSSFIAEKKFVMVNFYIPRSIWSSKDQDQTLEEAANLLKGEVAFAAVDASMETELADKYNVSGYPKLILFAGTYNKPCEYEDSWDEVEYWIRRRIFVQNITKKDDAKRILATDSEILLGFFDSLEGPESENFMKSSIQNLDYSYYQTTSPEVAKIFHIDPQIKRPAYITLKWNYMNSSITRSIIEDFVSTDKSPSATTAFTREIDPFIFQIPSKQLWLLDTKSGSETAKSAFEEASKAFGSQELFFVYSKIGDDEVGRLLASKFNFTGDSPRVIATYQSTGITIDTSGNITSSAIKSFGQDFLDKRVFSLG